LIWTYPDHHEVKNFLIAFPNGAGDQLLQLEESGLNAEHGGDGADRDLGGLSGIEDQEKNSRKELVIIACATVARAGAKPLPNLSPTPARVFEDSLQSIHPLAYIIVNK
jgi:hypothetical protein